MKILIDTCLFEDDRNFIGFIFENDEERIRVARQILEMPSKDGKRGYMRFDATNPKHIKLVHAFKTYLD